MARWDQISRDNLAAAGELMRSGRHRSSVSRAYYAAFSAASFALAGRGVRFPANWHAPSHRQLRMMVKRNLGGLPLVVRRRMMENLNGLYNDRIRADYHPQVFVGLEDAQRSVNRATLVIAAVGLSV